ncbi:Seleno protein U [Scenedesmus sp. NREL 46B-D3]|nr:Seleno protein U [Scenedesmus sp. NREL 46B-D3]
MQPGSTDFYDRLKGKMVIRSSDAAEVDIPSLWAPNEKAVPLHAHDPAAPHPHHPADHACCLAAPAAGARRPARELGIQLRRDVKPGLDAAGVRLYLVSIGTWERSGQFAEVTGFPRACLLADPASATYEALGLAKGLRATFLGSETAFSFLRRLRAPGGLSDLKHVLGRWKPWVPPKQDQALQQGGMFVFDGPRCVFSHFDKATGDHADLGEVLGLAQQLGGSLAASAAAAGAEDCGCGEPGQQ